LGTGGGILNAMKNISEEPFLVLNSDIFLESCKGQPVLSELIDHWDQSTMDALLLLKNKAAIDYAYDGDFNLGSDHRIVRNIQSCKSHGYILTGAYILHPRVFIGNDRHSFAIADVFFKALEDAKHQYFGLEFKNKWFDLGTIERIEKLNEYLLTK